MKLGPFEIDHPFILAPMAAITNSPFRRLMRSQGSSLVVSELISANGIHHQSPRSADLMKFHESERLVGLQLFGETADTLAAGAKKVESLGADFVDLNLGCPVKKVVTKGAGCSLCREEERLKQVLGAMVEAVKIPVSIKIRLGWDQEELYAARVIEIAAEVGIAWVAIHGRTRAQGYSGAADWDAMKTLKMHAKIPIIGNGDLTSPELAVERWRQSGVDAVMIGRGALRNPFIFKQSVSLMQNGFYLPPTLEDFLSLMDEQRTFIEEANSSRSAVLSGQKFLAWYSTGFPNCHDFRRLFTLKNPIDVWKLGKKYFETNFNERDWGFLAQPFLMGGEG